MNAPSNHGLPLHSDWLKYHQQRCHAHCSTHKCQKSSRPLANHDCCWSRWGAIGDTGETPNVVCAMTAQLTTDTIHAFATSVIDGDVLEFQTSFTGTAPAKCCIESHSEKNLFCHTCATNLCYRMGPGCPDLDPVLCDLELVERVSQGLKPLAVVVLSGKSEADTNSLEKSLESSGLPFWSFTNELGVQLVTLARDVRIDDLAEVRLWLMRLGLHSDQSNTGNGV